MLHQVLSLIENDEVEIGKSGVCILPLTDEDSDEKKCADVTTKQLFFISAQQFCRGCYFKAKLFIDVT